MNKQNTLVHHGTIVEGFSSATTLPFFEFMCKLGADAKCMHQRDKDEIITAATKAADLLKSPQRGADKAWVDGQLAVLVEKRVDAGPVYSGPEDIAIDHRDNRRSVGRRFVAETSD